MSWLGTMRNATPLALVAALVLTPAAVACTAVDGQQAVPTARTAAPTARTAAPTVRWNQVTGSLTQPTQVVAARDGTKRLFVVEKPGLVRVWSQGRLLARPYLDIRGRVSEQGERGLLSIAFAPDFSRRPFVYAAYSRNDGDLVVARFRARTAKANHLRAPTQRILLRVEHSTYSNHNGGQLMFGPDGRLYIGTGDGGGGGDPFRSAQRRTSLLGKVLRINVGKSCPGRLYCVPRSNPFAGATRGRGEIWLVGLRNPWRFSFDAATRELWIGDVGQDAWEEIDRVGPSAGGTNLGWSCWEARQRYNSDQCRAGASYRFPVVAVPHPKAESITGGFVYRGNRYPKARGYYVFGDYETGKVWTYHRGQGRRLQRQRLGGVSSFGVDDSGELWAVTLGGGLWRMKVR